MCSSKRHHHEQQTEEEQEKLVQWLGCVDVEGLVYEWMGKWLYIYEQMNRHGEWFFSRKMMILGGEHEQAPQFVCGCACVCILEHIVYPFSL